MSFPKTYQALREMARDEALRVPMARAIARKAGLRSVPGGDVVTSGVSTLIGASLGPTHVPLARQFSVDLSPYSRLRMASTHADVIYAYFSLGTGTALDPADWNLLPGYSEELGSSIFLRASTGTSGVTDFFYWIDLDEEHRVPMRLCFAQEDGLPGAPSPNHSSDLGGPVAILIQAE